MQVLLLNFQPIGFLRVKKTAISDTHASTTAVEFGFSISSSSKFEGELLYLQDLKQKAEININISENSTFVFPNEQNLVVIEQPGRHDFEIKRNGKLIEKRSILILPENKLSLKAVTSKLSNASESMKSVSFVDYKNSFIPKTVASEVDRGLGSEIYKTKVDSVVLILAGEGFGTGSIISKEGLVLTNWHVVENEAQVTVLFKPPGFGSIETAENYIGDVIKVDQQKDLALVKIRAFEKSISPIKLALEKDIQVAEDVHAIGHPKGNYWTYTRGVISQIRPQYEWQSDPTLVHKADVIQTQTPINPGNSGGPLLNDAGLMVGVNSFVDIESDGLNYAVAVTAVNEFITSKTESSQKLPKSKSENLKATELDRNEDGSIDLWAYDRNENGIFDRFDFDQNYDGLVDIIVFDKNENDVAEQTIRYLDTDDGTIAVIEFDDDEDGDVDEVGYDFDLDGEIDKLEAA
jgi:S1-C subfamily serine protease